MLLMDINAKKFYHWTNYYSHSKEDPHVYRYIFHTLLSCLVSDVFLPEVNKFDVDDLDLNFVLV